MSEPPESKAQDLNNATDGSSVAVEVRGGAQRDSEQQLPREELLYERGIQASRDAGATVVRWYHHLRFLLFGFYLVFAAAVFWLGLVRTALLLVHTLLKGVVRVLQFLGGSGPRSARIHHYPEAPVELWVREDAVRWWHHLRFVLFLGYLAVAAVGFWLWIIASALNGVRLLSAGLALFLSWLAGGGVVRTWGTVPESTQRVWSRRTRFYRELARPIARAIVTSRRTAVQFWHWGGAHKLAAIIATLLFIFLPAAYVVPRPLTVQILDDNVIQHLSTPEGSIRYLIHAASLKDPSKRYEFENERAVHLGKIDPQGLKNFLIAGRYYRVWVVGFRWPWLPTLFPNLIHATEVDQNGERIVDPQPVFAQQAVSGESP